MPFFTYKNIKITAVAASVPTTRISVDSFVDINGEETVEKFKTMTGIKSFHKALPHQTASDFGYAAANRILMEKNIDRGSIGALVFVAHSTDYRRPATACVLHHRLGLSKDCAAFDISLGCSAIVYGLQAACSMMESSDIERALLIVGETMTKMVAPKDRSVNMMFGDGGAAFLLEKDCNCIDEIKISLKTDGSGYSAIIAPAGGFRNMDSPREETEWSDGNVRTLHNIFMNGTEVFSFTISEVPAIVKEFMKKTGTTVDDYDCFAFHQANQFILKQVCKKTKIPAEKMPICLDRYGNTSAPAAAMALCDAYGNIDKETIRTLFCCFGVGLSWGVASVDINASDVFPIFETDEVFEEGFIDKPL